MPGAEAIPQNPKAFLEKDWLAEERQWAKRSLLAPALERWKGMPWEAEATALVEETLSGESSELLAESYGTLAPRYRELLKNAERDPLLLYLGAKAMFQERLNWRDAKEALDNAVAMGTGMPAALEILVIQFSMEQKKLRGFTRKPEQARLLETTIRAIDDGSYSLEDEAVFVRHQRNALNGVDSESVADVERWKEAIARSQWPEWVRLTLQGHGEVKQAWIERSSTWASEVSEAQWRGFALRLKAARDALAKASRLRPDRPEPASLMIPVCMGESVDLAEMRSWFDRSVSAQFDYLPAYTALLNAYLPRWQGSHELMLAFGKACAETERYDTMVPSRLMAACTEVTKEVGNALPVFRHEIVKESLVKISQGYLDAAVTASPEVRHLRFSNAAMCAWLADDDALAAKALEAAGPSLSHHTVAMLNGMLMHEKMLRAEVAADAGQYGEEVRKAVNPESKPTLEDMITSLDAIKVEALSPEAKDYVAELKDMLAFTKSVESGEWVPLKPRPHQISAYHTGGEWDVLEDGALSTIGDDANWHEWALRIPIKEDLELKCEISYEVPDVPNLLDFNFGFGPMLRWTPEIMGNCEGGVRYMVFKHKTGRECTQAFMIDPKEGTPDRLIKLKPANTFSVRIADGMTSYDVNGQSIVSKYPLEKLHVANPVGFVGFVVYGLPWGAKVSIRDIQVRKITAKELVTAPSVKAAAVSAPVAKATLLADEGKTSSKLTWQLTLLGVALMALFGVNRYVNNRES